MIARVVFGWLRRLFGGRPPDPLAGLALEATRAIVGLGNPGADYADTRHNVGFRVAEEIARRLAVPFVDRTNDLRSHLAVGQQGDLTMIVVKPQTFMNRSGEAVDALIDTTGLQPQHTLVVYDDMDLPFGTLRLRERGSPGTHNGMRSVVRSLATDDIPRLRIGISQASPGTATDHVLGEFEEGQRQAVDELIGRAADAALAWAIHGAASAMNRYNKT